MTYFLLLGGAIGGFRRFPVRRHLLSETDVSGGRGWRESAISGGLPKPTG